MALLIDETTLVKRPDVDEDELMEYGYMITESQKEGKTVTVRWWQPVKEDLGKTCNMWGVVKWIDLQGRRVKLVNDEASQWIPMDRIVKVRA